MKRFKNVIKSLWNIMNLQDVKVLPGQIAFFLMLSIFPLIILFGVIITKISIPVDQLIDLFEEFLPKNIYEMLLPFLNGKGFDTNVGIFMILGFIMASNGTDSIILASNRLYDFEDSDYIKRRIKAILLVILIIVTLIFAMFFLAFGDYIVKFIFDILNMDNIKNIVYNIFVYLKWPISMFIIFFMLKLLYVISPDKKIMSKNTTRGAIFSTLGISIVTFLYSHFFIKFTNYDIFYGSLSNIVIMMMWIYFVSYIIVIGIAINVNDYKNKELTSS